MGRSEQALFALKQLSKLTGEKEEPSYSVNAKEAYEAVLAEPESAESWKNLALAYRLASRAVEAISVARNAVGSSSKVAPYTIGLVEELLNSEPQAVVGYLEYLLILFGPTAIYLHLLGAARLKTPDIPEAVDAHRAACSLDDSNQYYWYALGKALERQGDLAGAQIAYEKALRLKPHYQKAHRALDKLISRIEDLTD